MVEALSNLDKLREEVFEGEDLDWRISPRLGPEMPYLETEEAWYFNRRGTDVVYRQTRDMDSMTTCYGCGENILAKLQIVNVWGDDSLGPCAVTEVNTREVRYCPNCEEEPESSVISA